MNFRMSLVQYQELDFLLKTPLVFTLFFTMRIFCDSLLSNQSDGELECIFIFGHVLVKPFLLNA